VASGDLTIVINSIKGNKADITFHLTNPASRQQYHNRDVKMEGTFADERTLNISYSTLFNMTGKITGDTYAGSMLRVRTSDFELKKQ
jgi:hypothetical protein